MNTYVSLPIFRGLDARGGKNYEQAYVYTHIRDNHSNDNNWKAQKCKPSAEFGGNIGIFGLKTTFHAYVLDEHTRMKNEL